MMMIFMFITATDENDHVEVKRILYNSVMPFKHHSAEANRFKFFKNSPIITNWSIIIIIRELEGN